MRGFADREGKNRKGRVRSSVLEGFYAEYHRCLKSGRTSYVKIGQKKLRKKVKIVQTFFVGHAIIITVKTPQYII